MSEDNEIIFIIKNDESARINNTLLNNHNNEKVVRSDEKGLRFIFNNEQRD
jgi:hypothetical protein